MSRTGQRGMSPRLLFALVVVGCLAVCPALAVASPESQALTRQGVADLEAKRFDAALGKFLAANQTDPKDGEAMFFQGVALNRLGRHRAALIRLMQAGSTGFAHPDVAFEMGWAMVELGEARAAIPLLEGYETAHPGRGQTSEFLGRAFLRLGDPARAEAKLNEALQRDPALRPTVLYYLAVLDQARGDREGVGNRLSQLLRDYPESPLARTLREQIAQLAAEAREGEKPWRVTASTSGGYNTNVIGLGDKVTLPSDISSKSSGFARFTFDASYDWGAGTQHLLSAGVGFLADVYEAIPLADLRDYVTFVDYRYLMSPQFSASVRVSDEVTELGGSLFRNEVTIRPSIANRWVDWLATELALTFGVSDYYFPVTSPVIKRDSFTTTVALTNYFRVPETQLRGRLGVFHITNEASGREFDISSTGLTVGLSHPLPWDVNADVFYTRTFDRSAHTSAFTLPTAFEYRRKDDVDRVAAQLSRPLADWVRAYVRYDFTNVDSTVQVFTYDQHVWSFGLVFSY